MILRCPIDGTLRLPCGCSAESYGSGHDEDHCACPRCGTIMALKRFPLTKTPSCGIIVAIRAG
mgnify:CR=1 FL=1